MSNEKIKQFNEVLSAFLVQVSPFIGTTYHSKFEQLIKYNAILPIEQFLVYALPVREKILNRDETYFTNNENHKETLGDNENILTEVLKLQNIYKKLDKDSQNNVWDFFQAMLILGEEYLKLKYV